MGKPLGEAVLALPNCTPVLYDGALPPGPEVLMGHLFDGVAAHMEDAPEAEGFRVATADPVDVASVLAESRADMLVNYLPVGSQ